MRKLLLLTLVLVMVVQAFAQQTRTISGTVTDQRTGAPLPGVSITPKGARQGTQSKEDGTFSITVPSTARTLVFSYVGYGTEEVNIGTSNTININLGGAGAKNLDEVVVVAYGTQSERKITGSVAKVGAAELESRPFASVDAMLQGKVPGLQSVSPTGQPGGIQQVRIRGIGSITAGAAPLYVVDGVPINTGDFSRLNNTSNALAGINPNDIESVTVLKDAASASIYGARAANGVILITTKKGRAGKSKVKLDADFGFGNLAYLNDLSKPLTRDEYFELTREGLINAGHPQNVIDNTLNTLGINNTANEDWVELVTRQGNTKNISTSVSGGDAKTTFYASAGYFKQEAVVITSDFTRYSSSLNLRHRASEKFTLGVNLTGSYVHQNAPAQSSAFRNPVAEAFWLRPSQNARNADGSLNLSTTTFNQLYNPLAIAELDRTQADIVKVLGNFSGEYEIIKNLKFTSRLGIDYANLEEEQYYNPFHGDARTVNGRVWNFSTRISNWVWSNLLNYRRDFMADKDLSMDLTVGYEAQKSKQRNVSARGEGVPTTTLIDLPVPSSPSQAAGARTDFSFVSMLSNLQLTFRSKYNLSGSIRRDGSSRFGSNNKYGTFWSVGAAWNIDQEPFLANSRFINSLKLRGSYGVNGNAEIGNYTWKGSYAFASNYNQQPGSAPNTVDNPELTWEVNKPFNVGIDATVWDGRLTVNADYYIRKTTDLILADPLSPTSGFNSVQANVGSMENKGVELAFTIIPVRTKDFTWDVSFNIALNKNKVTSLRNNADILALPAIRRVGEDFQSIYTRLWAGVNPDTGAPLWYTDATKTQTTTLFSNAQRVIIGSASPKGFGSFSTALSYKGFVLDAQFNYQYGNLVNDTWGFISWSDGFNPQLNKNRKQLGRWRQKGDITNIPKYVYGGANTSNAESSRWYYKGDFIRLRDVTLSYTLPKRVVDAIKMDNAKFYVRGTNLWTHAFDKNITFDPEQPITGLNDLQIMIQRTISVGVSVGF
ncbi:MAG TPA: TonB-dependent receptor [Chitinophagaceae bacterium]|nr:TonB-dependent receptor [Chitinophagaceae bacterium]